MLCCSWSRGEAAEYLLEKTAASSHQIERDINRMVTLPGQAVAPEFGHLKIKQLRKRAEWRFGRNKQIIPYNWTYNLYPLYV